MAGVKGRSGRTTNRDINFYDEVATLTFHQAYLLLKDPSISRLKKVQVCLPLAMKRIPDRVETVQFNVNIDNAMLDRMINVSERNLLSYKDLLDHNKLDDSANLGSGEGGTGLEADQSVSHGA